MAVAADRRPGAEQAHERRSLSRGALGDHDSRGFARTVAEACRNGDLMAHRDFALGFAAGVDAMVCGTVDYRAPMETVAGAIQDVYYDTSGGYRVAPGVGAAMRSPYTFACRPGADDEGLGDCDG